MVRCEVVLLADIRCQIVEFNAPFGIGMALGQIRLPIAQANRADTAPLPIEKIAFALVIAARKRGHHRDAVHGFGNGRVGQFAERGQHVLKSRRMSTRRAG